MEKIKCKNCWYFALWGSKPGAYCRYLDQTIPADKEKTRCKYYEQNESK